MTVCLRAGVSLVEISPEPGLELAGYPHYPRCNTGTHDSLFASCILLDDRKTKIAVVAMDLLMYSKKYVRRVKRRVQELTGIPQSHIMLCCSHTHSGPWASGRLDLQALEAGLQPDQAFLQELEDKLVALIVEACTNTFAAKIGIEKGYCGKEQGIGGNRRHPDGPADPEVWTLGIQDAEGNWKASLVRYALHPTVIHAESTVVTADYPGYIRAYLNKTKPGMVLLFAQGTAGDQSTRYFRNGQTFEEASRVGFTIGAEADRVLNSMPLRGEVKLSVKSVEAAIDLKVLPFREEAERRVREAKDRLTQLKVANAPYLEMQNAELNVLGAEDTLGYVLLQERGQGFELLDDEVPVQVQVIGIGDVRLVGVQGEIFMEFGLRIQAGSPAEKTFVIELANGCLPGYACTKEAYAEGGYETGTSLLTEKSGEILVEAALKLLREEW